MLANTIQYLKRNDYSVVSIFCHRCFLDIFCMVHVVPFYASSQSSEATELSDSQNHDGHCVPHILYCQSI